VAARVRLHHSSTIANTASKSVVLYNPAINWHFLAAFTVATNSFRERNLSWSPAYSRHIDFADSVSILTKKTIIRPPRHQILRKGSMELAGYLIYFRNFQASDARDKIFALLKFFPDSWNVHANYGKPTARIYQEIVRISIGESKGLAILSGLNCLQRTVELPSWCPDWNGPGPTNLPFFNQTFHTAGVSEAHAKFTEIMFHNRTMPAMEMRGILVDSIKAIFSFSKKYCEMDRAFVSEMQNFVFNARVLQGLASKRKLNKALSKTLYFFSLHYLRRMYGGVSDLSEIDAYSSNYISRSLQEGLFDIFLNRPKTWHLIPFGRKLVVTNTGFIGMMPEAVQNGDSIVIFRGGKVPFCVRQVHQKEAQMCFEVIGDW
jgi:hypothetical protein